MIREMSPNAYGRPNKSALHALVMLALALPACAAAIPQAQSPEAIVDPTLVDPPKVDDTEPVDVQQVAKTLARLRGLELRAPIVVEALDSKGFIERLETRSVGARSPQGASTNAFWIGFGFVPPKTSASNVIQGVLEEQISGFYDPGAKELFLRQAPDPSGRIVLRNANDRSTLVHEIEHALQDQNFRMHDLVTATDDDAALARLAVYEGDAMLAMLAYGVSRDPNHTDHWVSRVARFMKTKSLEELVRRGSHSERLLTAPPLVQRRVLFPYFDGLRLTTDIYRAGGLRLLSGLFDHLPSTTEQVLHPEKYVAGEAAIPVRAPAAPNGYTLLTTGKMGELQTAALLGQCVAPGVAEAASVGWGGDAYAILEGADKKISLLWSTVWDDDEAAGRFEQAILARSECLKTARLDDRVAREVTFVRSGRRVAYVQGLRDEERLSAAHRLLDLVGERSDDVAPLGPVSIPPLLIPEEVFLHRGVVTPTRYASRLLGLTIDAPDHFTAEPGVDGFEVIMKRKAPSFSFIAFDLALSTRNEAYELQYARAFMKGLRKAGSALGVEGAVYEGTEGWTMGARRARAYVWRLKNDFRLRLVFGSACGGKGTAIFVAIARDHATWRMLDGYASALELPSQDAPVCKYLSTVTD
jgi:hypothetical protein